MAGMVRKMVMALLPLMAACGSGEKSLYPNCAPNQVAIQGSLDFGGPDAGPPADAAVPEDGGPPGPIDYRNYHFQETIQASGYSFVNVAGIDPGHLDIVFSDGFTRLILEFTDELQPGGEVQAVGTFQTAEIDLGNCVTEGFSSTLTQSENASGGRFTLTNLREYMYCMGMPVPGTLYGCYSAPQ